MLRIRTRIVEDLIAARLRTHGGVLITGPKAVGKTTTARTFASSEIFLDQDRAGLIAAQTDPLLVLEGETLALSMSTSSLTVSGKLSGEGSIPPAARGSFS